MSNCEMCGKNSGLVTAMIEGVNMQVCRGCARYGRVIQSKPSFKKPKKLKRQEKEVLQLIVRDYDKIVRKAREKAGLSHKEFGAKIGEKESILHKIEAKDFKPSIALSRKLEKALNITLIEQVEVEKEKGKKGTQPQSMTIGDLIKLK